MNYIIIIIIIIIIIKEVLHYISCQFRLSTRNYGQLNNTKLCTVWWSIFYYCIKQTMNIYISLYIRMNVCWLFLKTAFTNSHVMSTKTQKRSAAVFLFDWTKFWENSALLLVNRVPWLAYDDFREKSWLDDGIKTTFFAYKTLYYLKLFYKKNTFYGFTSAVTHLGNWENTRKACNSLTFRSRSTTELFLCSPNIPRGLSRP